MSASLSMVAGWTHVSKSPFCVPGVATRVRRTCFFILEYAAEKLQVVELLGDVWHGRPKRLDELPLFLQKRFHRCFLCGDGDDVAPSILRDAAGGGGSRNASDQRGGERQTPGPALKRDLHGSARSIWQPLRGRRKSSVGGQGQLKICRPYNGEG